MALSGEGEAERHRVGRAGGQPGGRERAKKMGQIENRKTNSEFSLI